ncbi:MAG: hypothetical protein ACLPKI_06535 [Streptosporangiaceae bacterium]
MAILQVVSARAGHLTLFSTLIMLALATSSAAFAAVRAGWLRALAAAAAAFLLGLAAEWAGTRDCGSGSCSAPRGAAR